MIGSPRQLFLALKIYLKYHYQSNLKWGLIAINGGKESIGVAKIILENNAEPNIRCKVGSTPLLKWKHGDEILQLLSMYGITFKSINNCWYVRQWQVEKTKPLPPVLSGIFHFICRALTTYDNCFNLDSWMVLKIQGVQWIC